MTDRARVALFLTGLVALALLSQFFRVVLGAVAPDVMGDLGLSTTGYALAVGAFFISLMVAQIPLGIAFDRHGVRWPVTILTGLAVLGALAQAAATTPAEMIAARLLVGLGCAGNFMAAAMLCGTWFSGERYAGMLARVFALAGLGSLLAGTPLAALAQWLGWRGAFASLAAMAAVAGVVFFATVRDHPPGVVPPPRRAESVGQALAGIGAILRLPRMPLLMAMHFAAYASMLTLFGTWAGPYFADVHGLGPIERGHAISAMAIAQVAGVAFYGPLDRLFDTRKWVVVWGGAATLAAFAVLALVPRPSVWVAATLMTGLCFVAAYSVLIVAHGRATYPPHLAGRGVTTLNIAQVLGSLALPLSSGAVIEAATTGGVRDDLAYRLGFASIGAVLAVALVCYLFVPDRRPRS